MEPSDSPAEEHAADGPPSAGSPDAPTALDDRGGEPEQSESEPDGGSEVAVETADGLTIEADPDGISVDEWLEVDAAPADDGDASSASAPAPPSLPSAATVGDGGADETVQITADMLAPPTPTALPGAGQGQATADDVNGSGGGKGSGAGGPLDGAAAADGAVGEPGGADGESTTGTADTDPTTGDETGTAAAATTTGDTGAADTDPTTGDADTDPPGIATNDETGTAAATTTGDAEATLADTEAAGDADRRTTGDDNETTGDETGTAAADATTGDADTQAADAGDGDAESATDADTETTGDDAGAADATDGDAAATAPVPAVVRDGDEPLDATAVMPAVPAVEPASPPPTEPRRTGRRLVLATIGTAVVLYLLLAAAWAVDSATHRDRAMRGVHLEDIDVGGEDRDGMGDAIDTLTEALAASPLEVSVGTTTVATDPVTMGAVPDGDTMIDEALEARRGGFLPVRPITWAAGLFSRHTVPARYLVEPVTTRRGVDAVIEPALAEAVEPGLEFDGRSMVLVPGSPGVAVDPEAVIDALPATIEDGEPFRLEVDELEAAPTFSDDDIATLADELNEATSEPITVRVLDQEAAVSPNSQRSWIELDTSDGAAGWTVDERAALDELQPLFPALGSEDQQARFEVVDGEPIIIPAAETVVCCEDGAAETLVEAISSPIPVPSDDADDEDDAATDDGEEAEPELRVAQLEPKITGFDEGVAELETLGIVELVSTFTTEHACCENRVRNIQRFADLIQGTIIRPGEEFSLNGAVGRRTRENGFFAAGAIAQGNFEDQVGGGISQYATTFFNAAFFAGIEFLEYQSHSIYISRYPRGREATISWPRPDLKVLNNTPYGILVWNEYTPTSITVSFYSTDHLEVEALDRRRSSDRQCRIDITPRQITFPDGTVEEDTVRAIYRPGEGLDCNGNSTRPEEDEPPPPPTPEPDPDPDPEPEPPPPEPEPEPDPDPDPGDDGGDDDVLPPGG